MNTVKVCADNSYGRGAWWHWGGISRDVNLFADEDVRLVTQHIRSEPDLDAGSAKLFVKYRIKNLAEEAREVEVVSSVGEIKLTGSKKLDGNSEVVLQLTADMPRKAAKLWHFDHASLYTLDTEVRMDGVLVQEQSDRFGIRKVEFEKDGLYLNGERVRLNGFNRVSDSLDLETPNLMFW